MAEAAKDQDQSMEDILQSIKRIIAEEGDPAPAPAADVLELTDLLAEDGSVSKAASGNALPTMSIDEIMAAPIASGAAPEPVSMPEPEPVFEPAASIVEIAPVQEPEPVVPTVAEESLMSSEAVTASVSALNALRDSMAAATPARPTIVGDMAFRSGNTVEDLVLEALRPMLKDWLDTNLPALVEALVKKEISRISQR